MVEWRKTPRGVWINTATLRKGLSAVTFLVNFSTQELPAGELESISEAAFRAVGERLPGEVGEESHQVIHFFLSFVQLSLNPEQNIES